jgi:hypothetical protein
MVGSTVKSLHSVAFRVCVSRCHMALALHRISPPMSRMPSIAMSRSISRVSSLIAWATPH